MSKITELVFTDIETTAKTFTPGFQQTATDQTIEIACARVDLQTRKIVDRYETLVRPQPGNPQVLWNGILGAPAAWDLGTFHLKSDRFKNADWASATYLREALTVLSERFLTPGATVAGQNPQFDLRHYVRDYNACGVSFPLINYHVIDTSSPSIFPYMLGEVESLSLRHTRTWAGVDGQQSHRAMDDVLDSIQVFFALADRFKKVS